MSSIEYLGTVIGALADVFQPLEDSLATGETFSAFLTDYGWSLDPASDANAIGTAFASIPPVIGALRDAATAFSSAQASGGNVDYSQLVGDLTVAVVKVAETVNALTSATPNSAWPPPLNSAEFWEIFPLEVLDSLLCRYLERNHARIAASARLLGFIDRQYSIPSSTNRTPYNRAQIRWDRLLNAVEKPQDIAKDVYGWGEAFDVHGLLANLRDLAVAFDRAAVIHDAPHGLLNQYYDQGATGRKEAFELAIPVYWEISAVGNAFAMLAFELGVLPIPPVGNRSAAAVGLALYPRVTGTVSETIHVSDAVSLELQGGFSSGAPVRAEIRPDGATIFVDPSQIGTIQAATVLDAKPSPAWIPLGAPSSSRIEIRHAHAAVKAQGPVQDLEFIIDAGLDDAAVVIQFGEGDGFLHEIFGDSPQTASVGLDVTWSSKRGLQFSGQVKFEVTIPIHASIGGVVDFDSITIGLGASTAPPGVALQVSVTGGLNIGPVAATVDRVGVQAALGAPAPSKSGNLGNLDLNWAFLPPKGLGMSIDAGPVSGGGYILFDQDAGRYAGILQLTLPILSITAIGLLDTKLPGGETGYSFLIILTCDFPPIQLGYGFVLTGLGGLAGINRSIVVKALQDGVHTGSVDDILFPEDPVAHAPQLISDLEAIFPPKQGEYVFGPMAELGWGEPDPLIIAELGIILVLPDPLVIVLLGKLELSLPEPDSPVVDLKMEIAGSLDITNKLLALDTTLRDSHILVWNISGDTALRLAFGSQPNFAFAMGGLHPHFDPPPNFPTLQRMALSLSTGDNPRLLLGCYMAVTPNTFQVGALANAYVKFGDFSASGDFGFDALFHFSPFSFIIDLEANVQVSGPAGFSAGVHFDGHLSGLDPVRCWGTLVINFLGSHTFPINIPFGQPAVTKPVSPADPWGGLQAEIGRAANWTGTLPGADQPAVSVTQSQSQGSDKPTFVDPGGALTLRQKVLPLDRDIDKFGEADLPAPVRFGIGQVAAGSRTETSGPTGAVTGPFAAAQFEKMTDAEKLSRPSFEPMNAGVVIAADALAFGASRGRDYLYETIVVEATKPAKKYPLSGAAQMAAHLNGTAAKAPSRVNGLGKYSPPPSQPPAVDLARASYLIADVDKLQDATNILATAPAGGIPIPSPREKGAMLQALAAYYKAAPKDRGKYAVVGSWELT